MAAMETFNKYIMWWSICDENLAVQIR